MTDLATKANRKLKVVANSTQLTSLSNTYPGQIVYATTTGGVFTVDNYYKRNTANTTWVRVDPTLVTESAEQNTVNTQSGETKSLSIRRYRFLTMPTTYKFNIITGIEYVGGTLGDPTNVIAGVDALSDTGAPPALNGTILLGNTLEVPWAASTQRLSLISCSPIRGGTAIGVWMMCSGVANQSFIQTASGGSAFGKVIAYTAVPPSADTTAWSAQTEFFLKVYFRGYGT